MTEVAQKPEFEQNVSKDEESAPTQQQPLLSAVPRDVDPTKFRLAYGRQGIPQLISNLGDDKLLHRQKALVFLADLLKNPENIMQALSQDIIKKLIRMLQDNDLASRQKTTECLLTLSSEASGRALIIRHGSLLYLSKLFDDPDPLVRRNTHHIFSRSTINQAGVDNLLSYSLVPVLTKKLASERYDIQIHILQTLYNTIRMGREPANPSEAMKSDALTEFTKLINQTSVTDIKVQAAKCIMVLCFFSEAKKLACQGETIPGLIKLLHDGKSEVRAAAAGALMSITIEVDAKKILVKENCMPKLMGLLHDRNDAVVLNTIKVIANCSEDYRARFQLHSCLAKLEEIKARVDNTQISEAAAIAIKVITWRP